MLHPMAVYGNLLSGLLLHYLMKKVMPSFQLSLNITKNLINEIYSFASWIVVGRVNRLAVNALPPVLIGMYIGPSGIAYFDIGSKIVQALNNLIASSVSVLFPFVSELKTLKSTEKIKTSYIGANRLLSLVSSPIYCFGAIYSWDLLYLWLGSDVADATWMLTMTFFFGYYLSSSTMVPSFFSLGVGNSRILALNGFVQAIIVILFLPSLLKHFGLFGAGLNLILFESVSIITGIIITIKIINASAFTFWVRDRLLILFVSSVIFLALSPVKYLFFKGTMTRVETAGYLFFVLFFGLFIYGIIVNFSNILDEKTKGHLTKIIKR